MCCCTGCVGIIFGFLFLAIAGIGGYLTYDGFTNDTPNSLIYQVIGIGMIVVGLPVSIIFCVCCGPCMSCIKNKN